ELATLIGSSNESPFAITFLGNDGVALGGGLKSRDTGRLHFWQSKPPRLLNSLVLGEVYTVVSNGDGSKVGAWSVRPVVAGAGETDKNSTYEVFDKTGKQLVAFADKGHNVKAATFSADLTWVVAGDEQGVIR